MNEVRKYIGILAVDPGITCTGMAGFLKGKLVYSTGIRPLKPINNLDSIRKIADQIVLLWEERIGGLKYPETVVIEKPQIYQQAYLKGDPNDLVPLAILGGVLWERLQPKNIIFPLPKEWKSGNIDKAVQSNRTRQTLSDIEIEILKDDLEKVPERFQHNMYDAIGIGLWATKKRGDRK